MIWKYYQKNLESWALKENIRLPFIPEYCEQPYHMFYLLMPSLEKRNALIKHLKNNRINAVFHYLPLHLSKMGRKFGNKIGDYPITEDISARIVRLPIYNDLNVESLDLKYFYEF